MAEFFKEQNEIERQRRADDANFLTKGIFYFELRVSDKLASKINSKTSSFFFPLIINPQSYSMEEPFKLEKTYTQGGGLYVEENGIIERTITMQGHTGFKPRKFGNGASVAAVSLADNPGHSRLLSASVVDAISGHKHFQYLQDAVFRAYGDLKRDPETSEETRLFFHNPRDLESWEVKPVTFKLDRAVDKKFLYSYSIELLVVDKASAANIRFSEDKDLLDRLRDDIAMAKSYVDQATGFINDVTATIAELTAIVQNVATVVGTISDIIDAVKGVVEGIKDFIESPLAIMSAVTGAIDSITETVAAVADFQNIPDNYINSWRKMGQACDRLAATPSLFEPNAHATLRKARASQNLQTSSARALVNKNAGASAPGSINAFSKQGTEPLPGEIDRALAEFFAGSAINRYTSAIEVLIAQGDTLAALAARYLGDARLWQDIALLNGMKPPYIDAQADATLASPVNPIPGVYGVGSKLIIPTFGRAPRNEAVVPVLGVPQTASIEDQLMGTDFLLSPADDQGKQFDWEIDVAHGSVDFRTVSGVDNLAQGLKTRLSTEKGHNVLYKTLGLQRLVGLNLIDVNTQLSKFLVAAAVIEDPRVASIQRIEFIDSQSDVLETDMDVVPKGLSQGINVRAIGVI